MTFAGAQLTSSTMEGKSQSSRQARSFPLRLTVNRSGHSSCRLGELFATQVSHDNSFDETPDNIFLHKSHLSNMWGG